MMNAKHISVFFTLLIGFLCIFAKEGMTANMELVKEGYIKVSGGCLYHSEAEIRFMPKSGGNGEPIRLTPDQFFKKYLSGGDHRKASPWVGYNKGFEANDADIDQIVKMHPGAVVVDYHYPALDPTTNAWEDLILILERYEGDWFLIAVIHNEWTP